MKKNNVATYYVNTEVFLDSYFDPNIPHPNLYDYESNDATYKIYLRRKTKQDDLYIESIQKKIH